MTYLGFNQLNLTDTLLESIIVSDEEASLIKLGLQHVTVGLMYHNETRFRALTLTALERNISLPPHIKPSHDMDEKVQQLKELASKSGRYRDIFCDCGVCVKLAEKTVEPVLRWLLLECLYIDLSESKQEFRDPTGGQMALVNFCVLKAGIEDLEVYLKTGGGQIAVSVLKGNVTKMYNANPDIVIKKRDNILTSFMKQVKWKVHPLYKVTSLH